MNMSEFYSEFLFRYQTDDTPRKLSIKAYCIQEGGEFRNFIKWYRENKKRFRESEMGEIRVLSITVSGAPESVHSRAPVACPLSPVEENAVSFHLKLRNGIEITNFFKT